MGPSKLQPFLDAIRQTVAQIALREEIPAKFMLGDDQTEVLELENPDAKG
jgi:hypothetical protein